MSSMVVDGAAICEPGVCDVRDATTGREVLVSGRLAADTPLRLTARGRVVLLLLLLPLAYALLTTVSSPAASTGRDGHGQAHTVVVKPGETLWDIARSVAPRSDPRDLVSEIVDLNALPDPGSIRPGQPLDVPAR
jgi:hypothetical protein